MKKEDINFLSMCDVLLIKKIHARHTTTNIDDGHNSICFDLLPLEMRCYRLLTKKIGQRRYIDAFVIDGKF